LIKGSELGGDPLQHILIGVQFARIFFFILFFGFAGVDLCCQTLCRERRTPSHAVKTVSTSNTQSTLTLNFNSQCFMIRINWLKGSKQCKLKNAW